MPDPAKPRPRSEVLVRLLRPLASRGVALLKPTGVNPLALVGLHALLGFVAAILIAVGGQGYLVAAALLLQIKTLLDNIDGGLARTTGQVTLMGRYFDTGMDFFVNVALFAAFCRYGPPVLSLSAFALLTFILSLDYNAERLYKLERRPPANDNAPVGAPRLPYVFFKCLYDALLAPQDRFIGWLDRYGFQTLSGLGYERAPRELRLAWRDLFSTATLVNLGLSTQILLLGLCLVAGRPFWYVYGVFCQALYVLAVQILRCLRFCRHLKREECGNCPT